MNEDARLQRRLKRLAYERRKMLERREAFWREVERKLGRKIPDTGKKGD